MVDKDYRLTFAPPAIRDMERLGREAALQLAKDINAYLKTSPMPIGKSRIKKLTNFSPPLYRLRSGDFRAYYRIMERDVVILAVVHRKEGEKVLKKMKNRGQ